MFLFEYLKVLLSLFHAYQVEWSWNMLRYFWPLNLAHRLPHLLLVWIRDTHYLICRWYLTLTNLMGVLDLILNHINICLYYLYNLIICIILIIICKSN